jgi:large exoprotein involved in heme utilization and adhesion
MVEAGRVTLTDGAKINASTGSTGRGGDVTVLATDSITLSHPRPDTNTGLITNALAEGPAGQLRVSTPTLRLEGGVIQALTSGDGDAGTIQLQVGRLTLTGGAQISSSSGASNFVTGEQGVGTGQGGDVLIRAREFIAISGHDQENFFSGIFADTSGRGNAGHVRLVAPLVQLTDGGTIETTGFLGRAGDITIAADRVTVTGGATINTSAYGLGAGGTLSIRATDRLELSGLGSTIASQTQAQGPGGDITLQARQIQLSDRAVIAAESTGTGNAGSLTLAASDTLWLRGHSAVTTAASQATGGNIRVTAASLVRLQDSQLTASVGGGTGDGGNVTIDPEFMVLQGSQITANAFAGHGGRISLTASKAFLADPSSVVTASSTLGINGEVNIQAPVTQISGSLVPLLQAFARPATLLSTRCAERLREGTVSSLVVRGRDGVPAHPGGVVPLPLALAPPEAAVEGQDEASVGHVEGLEIPNTGDVYLRGTQAQAPRWEALDMDCARGREMQGTDGTTGP